ncbi:MAG: PAS domain S-box protein, partial [Deltaproteobacteria bacterium]|nr:PAS domain S-box protein [Deltaproteobacteria bacterium]
EASRKPGPPFEHAGDRLQILFENTPDGVLICESLGDGMDFRILDCNPSAETVTGHSRSDLVGKTLLQINVALRGSALIRSMRHAWQTRSAVRLEPFFYRGALVSAWLESIVFCLSSGEVAVIFRDVGRDVQARQALRKKEERLNQALEAAGDGLWEWNLASNQAHFSPSFYAMLGYAPGEFPAGYESWRNLIHPDDLEATERTIRVHAAEGTRFRAIFRARCRDGSWKWVQSRGKVVQRDEQDCPIRIVGLQTELEDLTDGQGDGTTYARNCKLQTPDPVRRP